MEKPQFSLEPHPNKLGGVQQGVIEIPYDLLEQLTRLADFRVRRNLPLTKNLLLQPPRLQGTS
jgi:hypothetical protein